MEVIFTDVVKYMVSVMIFIYLALCIVYLTLYSVYMVDTTFWSTVHENREDIRKMLPDIMRVLIYLDTIGIEWENRFNKETEEKE